MLHRKRIPRQKQLSDALLLWLNAAQKVRKHGRAVRFLDLADRLQKVENRRNYPRAKLFPTSTYRPTPEQTANQRERVQLVRQLNALIRRVVPATKPGLDCQGGTWLRPFSNRRKRFGFVNIIPIQGNQLLWDEISAFERMIELALEGGIDRIAQCGKCGQWIFRIKRHQNYCGFKCQQAFARRSPKYKEQRKGYMRRYRAFEKRRDQRAKREAGIEAKRRRRV